MPESLGGLNIKPFVLQSNLQAKGFFISVYYVVVTFYRVYTYCPSFLGQRCIRLTYSL